MNITPELLLDALTGKLLSGDIGQLTVELNALPAASVLSIAAQGGIRIEGDGNIVGDNNTSIVVKGEGAEELARVLRESLERGRVLFQLRPPVADFVGREQETATLENALRAGNHAGISGMGGTGKTELALLVAGRVTESYPDAQLFINLQGAGSKPSEPKDVLATCIRSLVGPDVKLPDDADALSQVYRNQLSGKRALIVLDNAADNTQIRPMLPPQGSALLVTSRLAFAFSGMTRVSVDQLQPIEARKLLISIAPHAALDVADQICLLCGYLPLAIRAAGSYLSVSIDIDPVDYAEQLRNERTRLETIGNEDVDLGIEASFGLSYERLSKEAAGVFCKLAIFPASFDAAAEEDICADHGHTYLTELLRRSFVLFDMSAKRYRMHDLVRLFADARLSPDERAQGLSLHATHYNAVLASANELYVKGGEAIKRGLTLVDLEWRNIEAGHMWAESEAEGNDHAAELAIAYAGGATSLLYVRQHARERVRWSELAVTAARRLQRRDSEGTALGNLGVAYTDLGEYKLAITFEEQALLIHRELGGNRKSEGAGLVNLGIAYKNLNDCRRAIEAYEQARIIYSEIGDRRGESFALGNMGVAYQKLNDIGRSIELQEQSLAMARETGDRRSEGNALGNLGLCYAMRREHTRAIEYYEGQLEIVREIGDQRGECNALVNLGTAYKNLGDIKRAIEFYEQRLAIARELGDRRVEADTLVIMGLESANLGDHRRAIEFYDQHLVIIRELGDLPGEGHALIIKSLAFDALGERAQAIATAEEALIILERIQDPDAAAVRAGLAEWRSQTAK